MPVCGLRRVMRASTQLAAISACLVMYGEPRPRRNIGGPARGNAVMIHASMHGHVAMQATLYWLVMAVQ